MNIEIGKKYFTREGGVVEAVSRVMPGVFKFNDNRTRFSTGEFVKGDLTPRDIVGPVYAEQDPLSFTTRCLACGDTISSKGMHVCEKPFSMRPVDGYEELRRVLELAVKQASEGKGRERHATTGDFTRQPLLEIARMVGLGYPLGQVMKKAQEASRLPNDRARAELLGAINYAAAAYLLLEEQDAT